ncbi:MAG: peptide deformylase [bacterium]|nr:peptide deformylase [bacterium]
MKKILQKEERGLRLNAKEIPVHEILTPKIQKILKEMSMSLVNEHDGVAIAAPQIGYSLRIFVVSGKIFDKDFMEEKKNGTPPPNLPLTKDEEKTYKDIVFINPVISKLSRKKEWMPEGCLSVRPIYGKTYRSEKATVEAYNENGRHFKMGGVGLLAQIFQHETDHLNGILFIDHAKELREELLPES